MTKLSKQERDAIVVSCRETWDGGYDADAAGQYCRVKELCDTADALEADIARLRGLLREIRREVDKPQYGLHDSTSMLINIRLILGREKAE
jgi:hypothetical protein